MNHKWLAALSGTIAFSLVVGMVPASAKKLPERNGKDLHIEAKTGLALRSDLLPQKSSKYDTSSKLVIIQCKGPIETDWKEKIEDLGVQLGDYIPDFAFIAKVSNDAERKQLAKLSFVKKVIPFHPSYKLAPELQDALDNKSQVEVAVIGFDGKTDMKKTLSRIGTRVLTSEKGKSGPRNISKLAISGNKLEKILESDDVIAVLPVTKKRLHNDVAAKIIHADELQGTGYTGENQIVGVADTGLDTGDIDNIHPDFMGQIQKFFAVARPGDASDPFGHGTHVAGSIVGTGRASDGKIKGMAPDAKLVFQSVVDEEGDFADFSFYGILDQAYKEGARIHSDSWGDDSSEYGALSQEADRFLWEHKDMVALIAAGNSGEWGEGTVSNPATAKNVIAVGASESDRPDIDDDDNLADNPNEVAYFSSLGPTADGRFKPDLVAPGTFILSTRSSRAEDYDQFWADYNNYYAFMGGTSMATPILAGGVAQVRQYLQEHDYDRPSGALIKSMLITGSDILLDPDFNAQGYGRANLENAIHTDFIDETKGLQTKGKTTYNIKVTDTKKPFTTTLVWTDYPGSPVAERALVNNLNLKVKSPTGKTYNGNDFFKPPFNNEVDNLNNVEQVWIPEPEKGTYTVTVEGYNVPFGPQPYAVSSTGQFVPEEMKEEIKKGTLGTAKGKKKYADYRITVRKPGKIKLSADWSEDTADVNLYLYDSRSKMLTEAVSDKLPETLEYEVSKAGTYKVRIQLNEGEAAAYTLNMSYPGK